MIDLLLQEPIQRLIEQWPMVALVGFVAIRLETTVRRCMDHYESMIDVLINK